MPQRDSHGGGWPSPSVFFFAGDIAYELRGVLDPASAAAPGVLIPYLLFYPAFLWAVLSFPGVVRDRDEGRKFWLDAATVVVGGGMPLWHWVMAPALARAFSRRRRC